MSVKIRRAALADVGAIAHVHVQAWRESYRGLMPQAVLDALSVDTRAGQWRRTLAEPDGQTFVYVAEFNDELCGFGSAGRVRWTGLSTDSEIAAIYLRDAIKRRGVGRALFRQMIVELTARGFRSTGLWVLTRNLPARSFYHAMGGRTGETRTEQRGELALDEIAYLWDDLSAIPAR